MGNRNKVVLCDTNVVLEFFKGNEVVVAQFREIQRKNIRISVVTSMEITFGSLNKPELNRLRKSLDRMETLQITPEISESAYELMHQYSLSHNLDLADSLIAATAIHYGIEVFTHNLKHFRYIEDLELYVP